MNSSFLLLWFAALLAPTYGFNKIECSADPSISQNLTCSQVKIGRKIQNIVYGVTLLKPLHKIWIRVAQLKQNRANQYLPGVFDVTKDVCALLAPGNFKFFENFIAMLEPEHFDNFKDLLHPCPYSGRVEVHLTYKGVAGVGGSVMGRGEYKTMVRIYTETNQTIFYLNTYYTVG